MVDEARCEGPVADLMRRLDDTLIAHNRTAVEFISGPTETRRSTYPLGALQQLVRNAVMHRTYDGTNALPARGKRLREAPRTRCRRVASVCGEAAQARWVR